MKFKIGDTVQTQRGVGKIVEFKLGQRRNLALVLYAPMTPPVWHDLAYVRQAPPQTPELRIGNTYELEDGTAVEITGLEETDVIERVRVTRRDEVRQVNVTNWMKYATFRRKNPKLLWKQESLPF